MEVWTAVPSVQLRLPLPAKLRLGRFGVQTTGHQLQGSSLSSLLHLSLSLMLSCSRAPPQTSSSIAGTSPMATRNVQTP